MDLAKENAEAVQRVLYGARTGVSLGASATTDGEEARALFLENVRIIFPGNQLTIKNKRHKPHVYLHPPIIEPHKLSQSNLSLSTGTTCHRWVQALSNYVTNAHHGSETVKGVKSPFPRYSNAS